MGIQQVPAYRRWETGVVLVCDRFGPSLSFYFHALWLWLHGYKVAVVNIHPDRRPNCLRFVGPWGNEERRNWLTDHIDDTYIVQRIDLLVARLRGEECRKVVVMGFGYGGTQALRVSGVEGIVAWYPSLAFHDGSAKTPPDLAKVGCPSLIMYGATDPETVQSLAVFDQAAGARADMRMELIPRTGHGFADWTIQGLLPSRLYRRRAAHEAWSEVGMWFIRTHS